MNKNKKILIEGKVYRTYTRKTKWHNFRMNNLTVLDNTQTGWTLNFPEQKVKFKKDDPIRITIETINSTNNESINNE